MERFIPSIGNVNWNIKELNRDQRNNILSRLVPAITHNEEEYQAIISYLHMKYPDLMDKNPDGMNLQWHYSPAKNKMTVHDPVANCDFDMYAFAYFDPERDYEPVTFGGSYIKSATPPDGYDMETDEDGRIPVGFGYVLFVDPDYRRMGIADHQWVSEAALYRRCGIRFQKEIQNEHSLKVTQAMFDDPNKCIITSWGRLKNDGTHAGIRCLLDYTDESLIRAWNELPNNIKDFDRPFYWNFLDRENLTIDKLIEPWK